MQSYLDLLNKVKTTGVQKPSGRQNMPDVIGLTHGTISMDLRDGLPLLTTKKMFWKGIVHELLWFMRGDTNIKYLVDNKVNIWNQDAYGWYLKHASDNNYDVNSILKENEDGSYSMFSIEEFVEKVRTTEMLPMYKGYMLGDLGKVYGHQWRNQDGVDQLRNIFEALRDNPFARYKILDAWNAKDFPEMALPPCHLLYQFLVEPIPYTKRMDMLWASDVPEFAKEGDLVEESNIPKYYLDLNMYQRSADMVLGVPFDIASMSILQSILAKALNMVPRYGFWIGGHCDIYVPHLSAVDIQLSRPVGKLPWLKITKDLHTFKDIMSLTITDFAVVDYYPADKLEAELFTGLKK